MISAPRPSVGSLIRLAGWSFVALALLTPLVAMQFTREVNWTAFDFAVAAALLAGAGLVLEFASRILRKPVHFVLAAAIVVVAVLLVWAEGAVGVFS